MLARGAVRPRSRRFRADDRDVDLADGHQTIRPLMTQILPRRFIVVLPRLLIGNAFFLLVRDCAMTG